MIQKIKSFLFENTTAKQTVAKNAIWLSAGTIGSRIIKALIIIYAARILGAEDYGIFSYALSLAALFSIFADAGTTAVVTREISKSPEEAERYLSTALTIKLYLVGLSFILIAFVAPLFATLKGAVILLPLAALLTVFDSLRDFSFSVTRAWEKMELEAGINMVTGIAITVLGFAALFLHPTPFTLMIGYILGSAIGLLAAILILWNLIKKIIGKFNKELAIKIIKESTPFALMGLLGALTINTDTIMIGWLRNATDVGLYSAVQRPVLLIYLLPSLIAMSAFPLVSKLARQNDERVRSIAEKTIGSLLMIALPIIVGGMVLSRQITGFLFGSEYISAASTFAVLISTLFFVFPASMIGNMIFAYNKQKSMVIFLAVGGLGNVFLDYLLIPKFGILGSAWATLISQSLAYGLAWNEMKNINNFYTLRHIKISAFASILMGLVAGLIAVAGANIIITIIVAGIFYFLLLYLFKEKHFMEIASPAMRKVRLIK